MTSDEDRREAILMGRIKQSRVNSTRQRTRDRAAGVYTPTYQEVRLPGLAGALAQVKAEIRRRSVVVRRGTSSGGSEATEERST